MSILTKKFLVSPFADDISLDSWGLADVVFTVNQIRKVGEIQAKMEFIFFEPFIWASVMDIFEVNSCVAEKKSDALSFSSDSPVSKLNLFRSWLEAGDVRWKVGSNNSIWSFVVVFDFWELFKVVSDSPPESIVFVLAGIESFEVSQHFSQIKVSQS